MYRMRSFVVRGDSALPLASIGKGENLRQGEGMGETSAPYARSSLRAASALGNHGEGEGFLRGVWLPAPARQVWCPVVALYVEPVGTEQSGTQTPS